jgi:hypothetical protein
MRRLLALIGIIAVAGITASLGSSAPQRAQGGYESWQTNKTCQPINVYQYTGSYEANIFNGSGWTGTFYAPYSGAVDAYCHWNGQTRHASTSGAGGLLFFTF